MKAGLLIVFIRRLVRFGKLVCVHIETKLEITWVSPPHLVLLGQARHGSIRFVHTSIYSMPCRAVPGLEGNVNGVLHIYVATLNNHVCSLPPLANVNWLASPEWLFLAK